MVGGAVAGVGRAWLTAIAASTRPGQARERRIPQRGELGNGPGRPGRPGRCGWARAMRVGQGGAGGQGDVLGPV
jgi:hypothetical protein